MNPCTPNINEIMDRPKTALKVRPHFELKKIHFCFNECIKLTGFSSSNRTHLHVDQSAHIHVLYPYDLGYIFLKVYSLQIGENTDYVTNEHSQNTPHSRMRNFSMHEGEITEFRLNDIRC